MAPCAGRITGHLPSGSSPCSLVAQSQAGRLRLGESVECLGPASQLAWLRGHPGNPSPFGVSLVLGTASLLHDIPSSSQPGPWPLKPVRGSGCELCPQIVPPRKGVHTRGNGSPERMAARMPWPPSRLQRPRPPRSPTASPSVLVLVSTKAPAQPVRERGAVPEPGQLARPQQESVPSPRHPARAGPGLLEGGVRCPAGLGAGERACVPSSPPGPSPSHLRAVLALGSSGQVREPCGRSCCPDSHPLGFKALVLTHRVKLGCEEASAAPPAPPPWP